MPKARRRLAAIVAIDVAGYSRLMQYGEAGVIARQETYHAELSDPTTGEHSDRELSDSTSNFLKYLAKSRPAPHNEY